MQQKIALLKIIISLYLVNTYAFGQLQLSVSTDKQNYSYGESIIIECSVKNLADTNAIIWASSASSCQAEFSFNSFNSWEHTACLTMTERIEIKPGNSRVYKWRIDPKKYGLPNKDGEQKIVGYFLGGLKDSITINAPKYYGGQFSVGFFDSLEAEINLLKDTLNVEVLSRSDYGSLGISESWQIEGFSIDSLVEKYSIDDRFKYVEYNPFTAYDSIYTTSPLSYYPLHVGDKWFYEVRKLENILDSLNTIIISDTFYVKVIADTIMPNGINYSVLNREFGHGKFVRENHNGIYYYTEYDSSDVLVYNYNATLGEYYEIDFQGLAIVQLSDKNKTYIFDDSVLTVKYDFDSFVPFEIYFAEELGPISFYSAHHEPIWYKCIGCIINGKVYGDTTVVGIKNKKSNKPISMKLSQNYPNPFNPTTTIKYEIPTSGNLNNVTLKVYDVLGKEVTTLINEQQKSGSYEVVFNASNLSSGVYYYQLKNSEYVKAKKMIILK